jgi:hypothetical protein
MIDVRPGSYAHSLSTKLQTDDNEHSNKAVITPPCPNNGKCGLYCAQCAVERDVADWADCTGFEVKVSTTYSAS